MIDGNFPDYQKVIPTNSAFDFAIDAQKFGEAIDRVSVVLSQKFQPIALKLDKCKMTVYSVDEKLVQAREEIDIDYHGQCLQIGFNASYLKEAIDNLFDKVTDKSNIQTHLFFTDSNSPLLIREMNDEDLLFVVMPVRIDTVIQA